MLTEALDERRANAGDPRLVAPYFALRAQWHWERGERAEAIGAMHRAVRGDASQQPWADTLATWRNLEGTAMR